MNYIMIYSVLMRLKATSLGSFDRFTTYTKEKEIDGEQYKLSLCTMLGQQDYNSLRPLGYPKTTCFLLCYSINKRETCKSIKEKWVPEIKRYMPDTPFILVDDYRLKLVSVKKGRKLALEIRAESYLECSAKNLRSFDEIVVEAVRIGNTGRKEDVKQKRKFENYTKEKDIDGESYSLSLSTMGGQEDYDSLRPLSYPNTTCFLLCFSINKRESFTNIESKWVVEIKEYMPGTPFILVGTKNDLREVDDPTLKLISVKEGKKLARKIGAERYLECSAKNITTFDDIVVEAVRAGLKKRKEDTKQDQNCVLG
ncbi:rho family gtpase [Holotrichia oblita]|uniref:Rho family gtpase n=1 Tax=Holotrichia oblita TaxID=644536 RepID=A0ACB9T0F2_HOLOL|nr:rho family gtpase [Holotrichia oblita]